MPSELKTPLILEIETENFVHAVSLLTCHGYEVISRADNPSRFVLRDSPPMLDEEPPGVA